MSVRKRRGPVKPDVTYLIGEPGQEQAFIPDHDGKLVGRGFKAFWDALREAERALDEPDEEGITSRERFLRGEDVP